MSPTISLVPVVLLLLAWQASNAEPVAIGAKKFTESVIPAEMAGH